MLDDASKLLAIVCMVVAAKHEGIVPNNPAFLRRVAYLNSAPNLKPLVECGFLVPLADASKQEQEQAEFRPEKETEADTEKESNLSDPPAADTDLSMPEPQPEKRKRTYPERFEAFWRDYPTDALMSKLKAFEQWKRLSPEDQDAAKRAIPGFKAHCSKNTTYRPVHAERFLSQRRFDGFNESPKSEVSPEQIAANLARREALYGPKTHKAMQ